eukprot:12697-Pelagococcus_subviridis.AAC.2
MTRISGFRFKALNPRSGRFRTVVVAHHSSAAGGAIGAPGGEHAHERRESRSRRRRAIPVLLSRAKRARTRTVVRPQPRGEKHPSIVFRSRIFL